MKRSGGVLGGFLAAALCVPIGFGAAKAETVHDLPPAPENHVLDVVGLFERHPEERKAIEARLVEMQETHGLPVYLVIYGTILHTRLEQQTSALYEAWIGQERDGVVAVWEADTRRLEFGLPGASYISLDDERGRLTRLPDYRVRPALGKVRAEVEGIDDKLEYLDRLSRALTAHVGWIVRDDQPNSGVSAGKVAAATLFLGGVLGVIGLVAGLRRKDAGKSKTRCHFPDVLVGSRLGASFGGGRVAVVDYSKEDPEEE